MRLRRTMAATAALALSAVGLAALPGAAATEPPTDGLVLHYPLTGTGGTTVQDASGNGLDGALAGGAELGASGVTLDGQGGHVVLPDDVIAGMDAITVSLDVLLEPPHSGNYFLFNLGNPAQGNPQQGDGYLFVTDTPSVARGSISPAAWGAEQNVSGTSRFARGVWQHITYTLADGTARLYIDGEQVGENTEITMTPGDIGDGQTTANYIGRSAYAADRTVDGTIKDFRIYDRALSGAEVADLTAVNAEASLALDVESFTLEGLDAVEADLELPATTPGGSALEWATSDAGVVAADGTITRPAAGEEPATATLTATLSQRGQSETKTFTVTVLPHPSDEARAQAATDALVVHNLDDVRGNLYLPTSGIDGASVSWASSDEDLITTTGEVQRPAPGEESATVELTATVTVGSSEATRVLVATVPPLPAPQDYEGYLFSYFLGEGLQHGEQVYFSLSEGNDPLHYDTLNDREPVMVSTSGEMGLRDPFIIRSPEGDKFYQIATDLRMWNQSSGSWDEVQRQGSRNVVVWESTDLVNWSESWVAQVAPENAGNAWAPEIFYDDTIGEYVVFWASKIYADDDPDHTGEAHNRMLYTTTRDFRNFSEPQTLIDTGYSVIDTTMIEHDGEVYRFSKNEANRSGSNPGGKYVFQEVGSGPLTDDFTLVREAVGAGDINQGEGPLVFKSNTEERWYLFIDEYGGRGYVPFTTTDLSSGEWTMIAAADYSFSQRYRHGTVLPVTRAEHERLQRAFQPDALVDSVADTEVETEAGVAPELPETVAVTYADGSTGELTVAWDEIDPADYAEAGRFEVRGDLGKGVWVDAVAVVTVTEPAATVDATALTRCVVGKVVVVAKVENEAATPAEVAISTPFGTREATIDAGRTASYAFSSRLASVPAGDVTVTVTGDDGQTTTVTAPFAAHSCG